MRLSAFHVLFALLVLSNCLGAVCAQVETDTRPLIKKWLRSETQSGIIYAGMPPRVKMTFLDLNGDGKKELAIQSNCAIVGNCSLKVYLKTGKAYKILLATDIVQTIKVLRTKKNHFHDLKLGTHDSASESYYRIFRFNGKEYKRKRCWDESYESIYKNGKWLWLKKPKIKYGCSEGY